MIISAYTISVVKLMSIIIDIKFFFAGMFTPYQAFLFFDSPVFLLESFFDAGIDDLFFEED